MMDTACHISCKTTCNRITVLSKVVAAKYESKKYLKFECIIFSTRLAFSSVIQLKTKHSLPFKICDRSFKMYLVADNGKPHSNQLKH